jgi:hypothetical protein
MIKYLQSFMPFIMGIDQSLLEHAKSYFAEEESIYIVYIKKDLIEISSNTKGKKLKRKELLKLILKNYILGICQSTRMS